MIDFHCHLDLFPNPAAVLADPRLSGIGVLSVTTTPSAWEGTSRLQDGQRGVRTALGLHPQLASERKHEMALIDSHIGDTQFIGEVGLDGSPAFRPTWQDQVDVFDTILRMCQETSDKILSIHSRQAAAPVLDALTNHLGGGQAILHWFSGTQRQLQRAVSLGCWFSVGPAMLRGAKGRALVAAMPREKVLLETDGPFATLNNAPLKPWDIKIAATALCDIWDTSVEEVTTQIRNNERVLLR